jgi:hypothetical protein
MWASSYRYKVYKGIRNVDIKLEKHIPSNMVIMGNNAIITYDGQPPTCYRCSEIGHIQIDCPGRRQLAPTTHSQRATWADVAASDKRGEQMDNRIVQQIQETGTEKGDNRNIEETRHERMSTEPENDKEKQTSEGREENSKKDIEQQNGNAQRSSGKQDTNNKEEDSEKGENDKGQFKDNRPTAIHADADDGRDRIEQDTTLVWEEGKTGKSWDVERHTPRERSRGEDTQDVSQGVENQKTGVGRPKKLKTDNEDQSQSSRNRSSTRPKKKPET